MAVMKSNVYIPTAIRTTEWSRKTLQAFPASVLALSLYFLLVLLKLYLQPFNNLQLFLNLCIVLVFLKFERFNGI